MNEALGDLQLQSGSKAIDSGNSGVANWPAKDFLGHARVDDAPTPNSGVGPIAFADRGAYEFVRSSVGVEHPKVATVSLGPAFPNPGRGIVTFAVQLPVAGAVAWTVTDIQGRTVANNSAAFPAGRANLRWSGLNRSGRPAPAGIYLVRVNANGETLTRRFAIVH